MVYEMGQLLLSFIKTSSNRNNEKVIMIQILHGRGGEHVPACTPRDTALDQ